MVLVKEIFLITKNFPKSELYGLTSQIRRAAVAIPSNIAEGHGRGSTRYFLQFAGIAYGSGLELETQLIIAKDVGFSSEKDCEKAELLLTEVLKMLNSMIRKMKGDFLEASR